MSMTTDQLRAKFLEYFSGKGHHRLPSSGLIPAHPAAPLFTNAGMVPFLPYFFGEEEPAFRRATTAQKCVRVRGKHDDIDVIGLSLRHLTFFEMLGNFSFGDYFKSEAISYGWDFLTEALGLDAERLWVTVHESDDEAVELWRDIAGIPARRIQRLTDDNFWEMGSTGPCGPSSEIFYDKGAEFGHDGGPAHGGDERFVEIWNLVFMQSERLDDGSLQPLPQRNIDTGAGMERILPILQGTSSVFETDVLRRLIGTAEELCGQAYGKDEERDVSLRILADHSRAVTFLLADGVIPSNEERGYVLRRIIRRAALHAQRAGARSGVLPRMAGAVAEVMREGHPELAPVIEQVQATLEREEHRFGETLSVGLGVLDSLITPESREIPGDVAFRLHDTYGFPVELTREIAAQRELRLDEEGFAAAMERQRDSARAAASGGDAATDTENARLVRERHGQTDFLGYEELDATGTLVGVFPTDDPNRVELFVNATPFYPEGGGQLGDTGTVTGEDGRGVVTDTDAPLPGVIRHHVEVTEGSFRPGRRVRLWVDADRRAALRRSHTGTHLLHWALREVLGKQVHQQGSLVAPDHIRFDFNHHSPMSGEQLAAVEDLIAGQLLGNARVRVTHTSQAEAKEAGAISFFGEKYGEVVRVVEAGDHSMELCGGTHVSALGDIGQLVIRSEASVGANLRRVEAYVGAAAYQESRRQRQLIQAAARSLKAKPEDLAAAVERLQEVQRAGERERRSLRRALDEYVAGNLVRQAQGGVVLARCDGYGQADLRQLAATALAATEVRAVGLIGTPEGSSVALAVAFSDGEGDAPAAIRTAAKTVGGGGGGKDPRQAVAGGRDVSRIDEAMEVLRGDLLGRVGGER
ncbi:alanine--tRNA ligase [Streptomyces sp. NPDC094447]|uniref:alanine--tRNA ligase n=1 Tax=Streptomyces sp. NPDC094447 TaxID=3366062 RepID=UPI0037FBC4A7